MARDRTRYYTVKPSGLGFWQPSQKMRALGFESVACGPDGPEARAIAASHNAKWDEVRRDNDTKKATRKNLDEITRLFAKIDNLCRRVKQDSAAAAAFADGLRGYARVIEADQAARSKSLDQTHIPEIDWNDATSELPELEKTDAALRSESESGMQSEHSNLDVMAVRNANGVNGHEHSASAKWLAWFSDFPTEQSEPSTRSIGT